MKTGIEIIAEERERQISQEGWTAGHDAQHQDSELAWAACYYAMPCVMRRAYLHGTVDIVTPEDFFAQTEWDEQWAKRQGWWAKRQGWQNRLRDLAKAGALIAAEIDRLQREETDDDQ